MSGHETELYADPNDWSWADRPDPSGHDFLPVVGHPDDNECTFREDGTDRTYCGLTREAHGYSPAQLDAAWEDGAVL